MTIKQLKKSLNKRSTPTPRPIKCTPRPTLINMDEFEKNKMTKKRPFVENTWYKWHVSLFSHILESVKKFAIYVKEKIMKLFEISAYNSISKDCKSEKINGAFNDKCIEYKHKGDENISI